MDWGFWYPGSGSSTGALVAGDLVVSQHEEKVDDGTGRVRYFLDRLDVSDPAEPKLLPQINIPGQVVHIDGDGKKLVTLEYTYAERKGLSWEQCYRQGTRAYLESEGGVCRIYRRRANALVLENDESARRVSMIELDNTKRVSESISVSDERLFVTTREVRNYNEGPGEPQLETFAFAETGQLVRLPPLSLEGAGYWGTLYARGARAFMSSQGALTVIDTRDTEQPSVQRHDMQGWGCSSLEVQGDRAFCALGQYGVFSIDL
jgi:hypothetical protein